MIKLDRSASIPIGEQLAEQLRFHLATGRFRPGERLPSTRALGEQLGVSFHTVRKSYQQLEAEGLLESRKGSGFTVIERAASPASDRMERGAGVVQDAIQKLIGLGLDEGEVEYLFQEQLAYLDDGERPKVVFAAPHRELAEVAAEQVSAALQERVEAVRLDAVSEHPDANLVLVPHAHYQRVSQAVARPDVLGVLVHLPTDALGLVARMLPHETLGIVTRYPDAVNPTITELRHAAAFSGQALALQSDASRSRLADFIADVDLLLYTPATRRKLRPLLDDVPHASLTYVVDPTSLDQVRDAVRR